jgi:hypothetical protein
MGKSGTILFVIIGIVLCVVALMYFAEPAGSLPGFMPGHAAGSLAHHAKHGLLALALGIVCFVIAWFSSGPKQTAA